VSWRDCNALPFVRRVHPRIPITGAVGLNIAGSSSASEDHREEYRAQRFRHREAFDREDKDERPIGWDKSAPLAIPIPARFFVLPLRAFVCASIRERERNTRSCLGA